MQIDDRNTNTSQGASRVAVMVGSITLYFSYNTLVAFRSPKHYIQREEKFSNTTARHRSELGCGGFDRLPSDEFFLTLEGAFSDMTTEIMLTRLGVSDYDARQQTLKPVEV